MNTTYICDEIYDELLKAMTQHPKFPADLIHQIAIMSEEAGEAVRAANLAVHESGSIDDVRKELVQTAAMCVRCLLNIDLHNELE